MSTKALRAALFLVLAAAPAGAQWQTIEPGGDTVCSDGTPYRFFVHPGDPGRLLVEFEGGGGCWSAETCAMEIYTRRVTTDPELARRLGLLVGIYDRGNPENPFREWTHVYIPYCTGDLHWGNSARVYAGASGTYTIQHKGAVNAAAALRWASENVPAPGQVAVAGCSAGGYGSILWAPALMSRYSGASVVHLSDSAAGVVPPGFFTTVLASWDVSAVWPKDIPPLALETPRPGPAHAGRPLHGHRRPLSAVHVLAVQRAHRFHPGLLLRPDPRQTPRPPPPTGRAQMQASIAAHQGRERQLRRLHRARLAALHHQQPGLLHHDRQRRPAGRLGGPPPVRPPARQRSLAEASMEPPGDAVPRGGRTGIGLCLSGGGFRATLFHLGALRRMNELGILSRDDFRTVASVSGGSIAAAGLATAYTRLPSRAGRPVPPEAWDREVAGPLRAFTRRDVRTGPSPEAPRPVEPLALRDHRRGAGRALREGSDGAAAGRASGAPRVPVPRHRHGVRRVVGRSTREWMGDYQVGYVTPPPDFPVARAVAASACFPPLFGPMRLRLDPSALKGGSAPHGPKRDACLSDFRLTDGGDYDNMGLEPVWKSHAVVLVSDAGGLFTNQSDRGLLWRVPRYQAIQERQARGLRKRWLIASFSEGDAGGNLLGRRRRRVPLRRRVARVFARAVARGHRRDPHRPRRVLGRGGGGAREPRLPPRRRRAATARALAAAGPGASGRRAAPAVVPAAGGEDAIRSALADSGKRRTWGRG